MNALVTKDNTSKRVCSLHLFEVSLKLIYLALSFFVNSYQHLFFIRRHLEMVKLGYGLWHVDLNGRCQHMLIMNDGGLL